MERGMGIKRYELSEVEWQRIEPLLPGKLGDRGRTGSDNRLFVNGCLWVLRSGAPSAERTWRRAMAVMRW